MCDDEIDISNCAKLIVVAGGTIVNDPNFEFGMTLLIDLTPRLEIGCEFVVGHDINRFQIENADEIIHHPFDDRLAPTTSNGFALFSVSG